MNNLVRMQESYQQLDMLTQKTWPELQHYGDVARFLSKTHLCTRLITIINRHPRMFSLPEFRQGMQDLTVSFQKESKDAPDAALIFVADSPGRYSVTLPERVWPKLTDLTEGAWELKAHIDPSISPEVHGSFNAANGMENAIVLPYVVGRVTKDLMQVFENTIPYVSGLLDSTLQAL